MEIPSHMENGSRLNGELPFFSAYFQFDLGAAPKQRVVRFFATLYAIPHPVQHYDADSRQQDPHDQELRTHLSHDVPGHIGVVSHVHAEPHIENKPGYELHCRDSKPTYS